MSRASTAIHVPQSAAVSALSRKFRAETPYIVHFDFDSDRLDAQAIAELDVQADWIIDHPNVKFRVYGHTDKVGNVDYNAALGLRRAERVIAHFMSRGISEDRLEAMASFGEELPLIDTQAPERMNRRTMTDVIGLIIPVEDDAIAGAGTFGLQTRVETDMIPDAGQAPDDETGPEGEDPSGENPSDGGTDEGSGKHPNAGRGNGDEEGDPGKSGGKNQGGDEIS